MVKLNKNGFTYGKSRGNNIFWKLNRDGVGLVVVDWSEGDNVHIEIVTSHDVFENTYKCEDAIKISSDEFLDKLCEVINKIKLIK